MSTTQYICLNGQKLRADQPVLTADNRAFRYGDALFETIRCIHQVPMFFQDHYQRLLSGMTVLKMQSHSLPPARSLREQIISLVTKNRLFGDVRIRLTVFREDGGLYTPAINKVNYLIEATALNTHYYPLNPKGLLIDIYPDDLKTQNRLSPFKSANSLLFVLAGHYRKEHQLDEVLILNQQHKIIETLSSNLYWIKKGIIHTPLRSSGCIDGIMRKQIISIIKQQNQPLIEVEGTTTETLLQADEIFISNAIQGLQWIVGLDRKRYYCNYTKKLSQLLNEYAANYLKDSQES